MTAATSTEITGGAGFTYEDTVVAYYLSSLLREEGAALQSGIVKSVAVQQSGHDQPMDDLIVGFDDQGIARNLDLQIKTAVAVSSGNEAFKDVVSHALETRAKEGFQVDRDAYGFAAQRIAVAGLQSLKRLIEWAKASPDAPHFDRRFQAGGSAAKPERDMRDDLKTLVGAASIDEEQAFYRQFVGERFDGLEQGGALRAEVTNRLQELVASNEDGQSTLLFDRLCRIVRDGAGTARKWTRASILNQLRGGARLRIAPNYRSDVEIINQFSAGGIAEIVDDIEGFRVERPELREQISQALATHRVVNISGLPGCGKSVVLRRVASEAMTVGPILFLKSDRLSGKSWVEFAAALGLRHRKADELLAEIGASGTPVLFVDGIDRINPDQKRIVLDLLGAIEGNPALNNWKALASSRDQGLETYRAWFPPSFYKGSSIGDVQVKPFDDSEAEALATEKPGLRRLLMGTSAVQDIARRPFFAAVLARTFGDDTETPQTETDLINAWWSRAGHDAPPNASPQRQRALLDLAEQGVGNLGKNIPARTLSSPTFDHIAALKDDLVIRGHDGDASFSFTHDIFFEWVFFRLLIDLGPDWIQGIARAGEPPLLGRVVGLLAQHALTATGRWSAGYGTLAASSLRPQWRREWLTAPPFTSAFASGHAEFTALLSQNDFALLEKALVWFQAQHTIPSPLVLAQTERKVAGIDRIQAAEMLSWPSDFDSWARLIDWLLSIAAEVPVRLIPSIVEIFSVWQNALSDLRNLRSKAIVDRCSQWLVDMERALYSDRRSMDGGKWDVLAGDALTRLARSFRILIIRAARAYPSPTEALLDRAVANRAMRSAAYSDLMALAWMLAEVSPDKLADVAKAEICQELPQDKADRLERQEQERLERLRRIREKPETERTENEVRELESFHFPISIDDDLHDDIGIDGHHNYYFPVSARHEPFASLFNLKPDVALRLVRDLSDHATLGWRQLKKLSRRRQGTPIPIVVAFPWGVQEFWGDWPTYNWHLGQLGPQPLECAFLAMSYWAFREIEGGRPVDDVIRQVVEGNEGVAAAGLGLVLALETYHLSEVTLAFVTCQRLWQFDIARVQQEPTRNLDIMGYGFLSRLTGDKGAAKEYLDKRVSRSRDVRALAVRFAVRSEASLREQFRQAIGAFPENLPFELEEQRSNSAVASSLTESAKEYAAIAEAENYKRYRTEDDRIVVAYEPPVSAEAVARSEAAGRYLNQAGYLGWAMKSLRDFKLSPEKSLADAVALARPIYHPGLFKVRLDVGDHTPQSLVAATAACVVCFGDKASDDYSWALDVLSKVDRMREPDGTFPGSQIAWHPGIQLVYALSHLRRTETENLDPARRLLGLTRSNHEGTSEFALAALLADPAPQVSWTAAQLALDLAYYFQRVRTARGDRISAAAVQWRKKAYKKAEKGLTSKTPAPFAALPPAWISFDGDAVFDDDGAGLREPDPLFDPQRAETSMGKFPIEQWCASPIYKPLALDLLRGLVKWTSERLNPRGIGHHRRNREAGLFQWNDRLGDLLARAAPEFGTALVIEEFVTPFLGGEEALQVLAEFADKTVTRHVLDASAIVPGTLEILAVCVERVVTDSVFRPGSYRGGEMSGHELPKLVRALLMVAVEEANGAARFVNGDWTEIGIVMPLVTRLVSATGWSADVMTSFLLLCERAGTAYPLDDFIVQTTAVLDALENAKGNWVGTSLAARTAATVQRLADANFPLRPHQAQGLLRILDALIDLGDRRSAALEQTEAFKGVQVAGQLEGAATR